MSLRQLYSMGWSTNQPARFVVVWNLRSSQWGQIFIDGAFSFCAPAFFSWFFWSIFVLLQHVSFITILWKCICMKERKKEMLLQKIFLLIAPRSSFKKWQFHYCRLIMSYPTSSDGVAVSTFASYPGDPGSIPGIYYFCWGQQIW